MTEPVGDSEAFFSATIDVAPPRWPGAVVARAIKRKRHGCGAVGQLTFVARTLLLVSATALSHQSQLAACGLFRSQIERACDSHVWVLG